MTTFAKEDFAASSYFANRLPLPENVLNLVLSRRSPQDRQLLIDVGCGPGIATFPFSPYFQKVIGYDASTVMINQAREVNRFGNASFTVAPAERIPLEDSTVDVVISQTAVHWFDIEPWKKEMARIVKPGGILVIWGYIDGGITGAVEASKAYSKWIHDADKLGPYWEWRGKEILENWYAEVVFDDKDWEDRSYWYYKASVEKHDPPERANELQIGIGEPMFVMEGALGGPFESFVRSWSAVHNWKRAHPDAKPKSEDGTGDIVDQMMEAIVRAETSWGFTEEEIISRTWKDKEVQFVWDATLLLAKRRPWN